MKRVSLLVLVSALLLTACASPGPTPTPTRTPPPNCTEVDVQQCINDLGRAENALNARINQALAQPGTLASTLAELELLREDVEKVECKPCLQAFHDRVVALQSFRVDGYRAIASDTVEPGYDLRVVQEMVGQQGNRLQDIERLYPGKGMLWLWGEERHHVEYSVTGTATKAQIEFVNSKGQRAARRIDVPWSDAIDAPKSWVVMLAALRLDASGTLRVTIKIDGEVIADAPGTEPAGGAWVAAVVGTHYALQ